MVTNGDEGSRRSGRIRGATLAARQKLSNATKIVKKDLSKATKPYADRPEFGARIFGFLLVGLVSLCLR